MIKVVLLPLGIILLLAAALPAQTNSATDMAVNRAVMDQANTILLRQKLEDAKATVARGDLLGAAKLYEDAYALVNQIGSGIDAETAQTISGLVDARLQLARQAQKDGNLPEANIQVTRALRVDPHNPAVIKFKMENDQMMAAMKGRVPDTATMEKIPAIKNDKTQAGTLVQDGKLLYEAGKFDEAEARLNQALKLDPDNQGAFYYLSLVQQASYARAEHDRTTQGGESMVEVSKAWSPRLSLDLPVPNPYVTNTDVHTGVGREVIYRKLDSIRLDSISWPDGLPLSEVIRYLGEQSRLRDPEHKGINFIFNPNIDVSALANNTAAGGQGGGGAGAFGAGAGNPAGPVPLNQATGLPETTGAGAAPETADPTAINVRLVMNDISLHDAVDAIVLVADHPIKYSVEDYAVVFSAKPPGPEPPVLEMRAFKVDPNTFYDGLQSVSTINFGSANSSSSSTGGTSGTGGTTGGTTGGNTGGNNSNGSNGSSTTGAEVPTIQIPSGGGGGGGNVGGGGGGGRGGGGNVGGGANAGGGANGATAGGNTGVGGLSYINPTGNTAQQVTLAVQAFFNAVGVNLTAPGRSVAFNDKLGLLFVKAAPGELDTVERVIQNLNQVAPEVHIKTRFIEINQDDQSALGFNWYLGNFVNGTVVANGGSAPSLTVPVSSANPLGAFPGNTAASVIPGAASDQNVTAGLRQSAPTIATITGILTDPNFRVAIQALQQRTGVESLAEPEAVVVSGRQTQMRATDIQFILTGFSFESGVATTGTSATTPVTGTTVSATPNSAITPNTQEFELGPTLDVVPYVLSDGYTINLTLIPQVLQFLQYDPVPEVPGYTPAVSTTSGGVSTLPTVLPHFTVRSIITEVNIWDNQTVVLGGLVSSEINTTKDQVPFLGDLPLVGRLFQSQSKTSNKKNLMIFVTATIVDPAGNRVHSDDDVPFNPATIPIQPVVEGQTFTTNSPTGTMAPPK